MGLFSSKKKDSLVKYRIVQGSVDKLYYIESTRSGEWGWLDNCEQFDANKYRPGDSSLSNGIDSLNEALSVVKGLAKEEKLRKQTYTEVAIKGD